MYDYVIIGAGPAGLTLAWYLAKKKRKILLLGRESEVGGCHRVRRVENDGISYFTEHGPRIYIDNYFQLQFLLKDMGIKWDNLFTKYDFSVNISINQIFQTLTIRELLFFIYEFMKLFIDESHAKNTTLLQFMIDNRFTNDSKKIIDRICRLTDGGRIDNYTLFEFLEVFNQNFFYQTYQPLLPNDKGLFKIWVEKLLKTGYVDIHYNVFVTSMITEFTVLTNEGVFSGSQIIFAIPPKPFVNILENSYNPNLFGNILSLKKWSLESSYINYISVTLHWKNKLNLPKLWGSTDTDWGVIFIILSDYMDFTNEGSKTVISMAATLTNKKSTFNGKTLDECNEDEMIQEMIRQLNEVFDNKLHKPDVSILSPGVYKDGIQRQWISTDTAFIYTPKGYATSTSNGRIHWIGPHSGKSNYHFTSMESAMENATWLLDKLENITISTPKLITVKMAVGMIMLLIGMLIICRYG